MRSATPSTAKARRSTPKAGCATGGRLRTSRIFKPPSSKLAAQYDTYKPFPDLALNGKQTLGENIADVAGLAAAYDGYKASLAGQACARDRTD